MTRKLILVVKELTLVSSYPVVGGQRIIGLFSTEKPFA
jgi:hypothetical protein